MIRKNSILLCILLVFITFSASAQIVVFYKCGETSLESPMIKPYINIFNYGPDGAELKNIKIRYFYSNEGGAEERSQIEYAVVGSSYVKVTFETGFFEISFPGADMVIPPGGGETGVIQLKINKQDWSNYDQSNDFSFNPTYTEFRDTERIAAYHNGVLVWGTEHNAEPSPTPRTNR